MRRTALFAKRVLDVVVAAGLLLALSPVLLLTAIAVRCAIGKPVFFRQERPGYRARPFEILKFRTLREAVDLNGEPLPDEERMTTFGRFLRATSLDELPELLNVLKGEMSLVGPRPLLMEYLELYTPEQMRRHEMRPGITGLAQVMGRNAINWEERFVLDTWYVDNWSLWLDFQIIMKTIGVVVLRKGITAPGHVTMERFRG